MPKKCDDVITVNEEIYIRKGSLEEKKVARVKTIQDHPFTIGKQWYIETATKYYAGDVVAVTDKWIVLERAAWVPDTGRFNEFLKTGNTSELEPCDVPVVIAVGAIVAAMPSKIEKMEVK